MRTHNEIRSPRANKRIVFSRKSIHRNFVRSGYRTIHVAFPPSSSSFSSFFAICWWCVYMRLYPQALQCTYTRHIACNGHHHQQQQRRSYGTSTKEEKNLWKSRPIYRSIEHWTSSWQINWLLRVANDTFDREKKFTASNLCAILNGYWPRHTTHTHTYKPMLMVRRWASR